MDQFIGFETLGPSKGTMDHGKNLQKKIKIRKRDYDVHLLSKTNKQDFLVPEHFKPVISFWSTSFDILAYAVVNNPNFAFNLSTFGTFPQNIAVKPGKLLKLAELFRYNGDGTNDGVTCNVCGHVMSDWSSEPDSDVTCSNCSQQNLTTFNSANCASEWTPSAERHDFLGFEEKNCEGVCGNPCCNSCSRHADEPMNPRNEISDCPDSGQTDYREGHEGVESWNGESSATDPDTLLSLDSSERVTIPTADDDVPPVNSEFNNTVEDLLAISLEGEGHTEVKGQRVLNQSKLAFDQLRISNEVLGDHKQPPENSTKELSEAERCTETRQEFRLRLLGIVHRLDHATGNPEYLMLSGRELSYNSDFPKQHLVKKLAKSGFFYEGIGDSVHCFSCKVRLWCWDENDDPHVEHARFSPCCSFLRSVKGDNFVCAVQNSVPKPHLQSVKLGKQMTFTEKRENEQGCSSQKAQVDEDQCRTGQEEQEQEADRKEKERQHMLMVEEMKRETAVKLDKLAREKEEREDARNEREHRMKLELLQMENARTQGEMKRRHLTATPVLQGIKGPKIPPFEEGKDNMDAYIERFQRYATAQNWPREQWGANLSALLKGKALDVFSRLPVDDALNFEVLKGALLRRFEKTEEGFRKSFRSSRPEQGETFSQFAVRLDSYLEKWIVMTKTEKTYEKLKDLMVRDQFLHCCDHDLALFLKERIPDTIAKMAKLADQFAEAREARSNQLTVKTPHRSDQSNSANAGNLRMMSGSRRPANQTAGYGSISNTDQGSNPTAGHGSISASGRGQDKKCYICGKNGHLSFQCMMKKKNPLAGVSGTGGEKLEKKQEQNVGDKPDSRRWNRRRVGGRGLGNPDRGTYPDSGDPDTPSLSASCHVKLSCFPSMPVVNGYVGDHFVQVLRDSGCSGIVVRRNLIRDDQLTGEKKICSLADGSRIQVDIANVEIDSPYFVGSVNAWVVDTPLYDLIIGNVDGALSPENPDRHWSKKESSIHAVQTRGQKQREEAAYRPLKVPIALDKMGDVDELKMLQQQDDTLKKIRDHAAKNDVLERDDGGRSGFCVIKGILYRKFSSPAVNNGREFKQLVVPQKYRHTVLKLAHDSIMAGHLGAKHTSSRILAEFFWPGVQGDITRFCRSCDVCQRTFPKGRVTKAPLGSMPIIDTPFKRIAVDLIGHYNLPLTEGIGTYSQSLIMPPGTQKR